MIPLSAYQKENVVSVDNLEAKIARYGDALTMLRCAPSGAYPFPIPGEYTNWRDEQQSWSQTAVLFDQSFHMTDYTFKGPQVRQLMSDLGVNSFANFGPNKAKQFVACDESGHLIGDAILFGHSEHEYSLVGSPTVPHWVAFHAESGDYDVEVIADERSVANGSRRRYYRYQLQGPQALAIAQRAHGGRIEHIKFFNVGEFDIAGRRVRALNHTMTGIPGQEMTGLELFGPIDDGPAVLEALLDAGGEFGMLQGGAMAYSTTALESGWIGLMLPPLYTGAATKAFREWLPANGYEANASLGGSFEGGEIQDYYVTPWDVGHGRLVKFDHDFVGDSALQAVADQPHRRKVWLRWNTDDVTRLLGDGLFGGPNRTKYLAAPYAVYVTYQYDAVLLGDQLVGTSNRAGYTVNVGAWSSLAIIDETHVRDGAEVTVVWGEPSQRRPGVEQHVQTHVRATISTRPLA
jgi:vanillate/3-O-methylgallate O-demethylase